MMFSKEYFKYLLTSNRYLLILVFFLFAFNAIGNTIKGLDLLLQGFLAVLFSFILPAFTSFLCASQSGKSQSVFEQFLLLSAGDQSVSDRQ